MKRIIHFIKGNLGASQRTSRCAIWKAKAGVGLSHQLSQNTGEIGRIVCSKYAQWVKQGFV
jgi:hypothetical protein